MWCGVLCVCVCVFAYVCVCVFSHVRVCERTRVGCCSYAVFFLEDVEEYVGMWDG